MRTNFIAEVTQTDEFKSDIRLKRSLRMFEAQSVLFAPKVSRRALMELGLETAQARRLRVNVWRNHNFESMVSLVTPYCAYAGCQTSFHLGGYDDTLMFSSRQEADADLIWLDSSRFLARTGLSDWLQWLEGRLHSLRAITAAPIILATWWIDDSGAAEAIQILADKLLAVYFADMEAVCVQAGVPLLDPRSAAMAGTPVSSDAQLVLARELSCHWLSASLLPPIKAVALDLDNTLHSGVLGEDGIQGVRLTSDHVEFQRYVKSLRQRGIFIALVSRNERKDVEELFARRQDYPLRWKDFSATEVSWGDKATAIEIIAKSLRIAPNAVLFVDDNLGELAAVSLQLPQVHIAYAHPDASVTRRVVHFYPGLWRWKLESDDTKRIEDLEANIERESLAASVIAPTDYLRSLQITLVYRYDPQEQLTRLADLCNKTNQFNLSLRRLNASELAEYFCRKDTCVASVQITDRFADSGIIAVIVATRQSEQLVVDELCVSCRALGRQLENTIILFALRNMPILAGCKEVVFRVRHGPRNQPALQWLADLVGQTEGPAPGVFAVPVQHLMDFVAPEGVTVTMKMKEL